jgi:hypothetical protein
MPRTSAKPVLALHQGTNANLMADVARLHIPDGALVADVCWGQGVFWRKTDTTRFTLLGADLDLARVQAAKRAVDQDPWLDVRTPTPTFLHADCTALPYRGQSLDVVVLDPPYMHRGSRYTSNFYNNHLTTGMSHQAILRERYCRAMMEAAWALKPGGTLLVKGKDEVEGRRLRSCFLELHRAAERCGFTYRHQFYFASEGGPGLLPLPGHTQHHPKLNLSHLLVFHLTDPPRRLTRGRPRKDSHSTTLNGDRGKGYLRDRLMQEHPAIYARYLAGELGSVTAAAKEAGLVRGR